MSAPSSMVIFGVRRLFGDDFEGFESLELRRHPWVQKANAAGLRHWWDRVNDAQRDAYVLYFGDIIAHLGPEHSDVIGVLPNDLIARCDAASDKISRSGLAPDFDPPQLWCQWFDDF
ncbi:MAG: hypothetical protein K2X32_04610 [Phycisphaerales bacterium]|nr:hypothetical protein [Phycisphaerales bacterium]